MNSQLFTVVPSKENAQQLHQLTKTIICEKLASIIKQVADQLPVNLCHEINTLKIDPEGIANPALFHYYFQLKAAIASYELDKILDVISIISHQPVMVHQQHQGSPDIVSAVTSEWEKDLLSTKVRKESISEFGIENNCELIQPVFNIALTEQVGYIRSALDILKNTDSHHHYSATENLLAIKLFNGTVRGFSYQAAYGNIYIRIPKESDSAVAYYLEHIVHECAHQHLFSLQLISPIVLNHPNELFAAPIRKQPRPMDGIFHACFVLARMVRCFRKTPDYLSKDSHAEFLNRIESWFEKSYTTVQQHAKLSEQGKNIFKTFKECAYE